MADPTVQLALSLLQRVLKTGSSHRNRIKSSVDVGLQLGEVEQHNTYCSSLVQYPC